MNYDLPALLRELLYGVRPALLSMQELEASTGIPTSTISNKINGQTGFTATQYIAIARAYAQHGEFRPANLVVIEGYSIAPVDCKCQPNGSMDDEISEFVEIAGKVKTKFDNGDRKGAARLIPGAGLIVTRMEREAKS
jgi:hypothetical protein